MFNEDIPLMHTLNSLLHLLLLAVFLMSCSGQQVENSNNQLEALGNLRNEIIRALSEPISSSLTIKEDIEAQIIFSVPYAIRNDEKYLVGNLGPWLVSQISDICTNDTDVHFFIISYGQIIYYEKLINPAVTFDGYYFTKIKPSSRKIEFIVKNKRLEKIIVK